MFAIIEATGPGENAFRLITEGLKSGKHVISANKAELANRMPDIIDAEKEAKDGARLLFEASVAGGRLLACIFPSGSSRSDPFPRNNDTSGIPIIRNVQRALSGDVIRRILGILNGTSNFILSRMQVGGCTFELALDEAKQLGYAEGELRLSAVV